MSKEAMKLALEALIQAERDGYWSRDTSIAGEALREALASEAIEQPSQQEPVVWMYVNKSTHETKFQKNMRDVVDHSLWSEVPLYGEPLANHELQCVCGAVWLGDELVHLPDKRPPAQRTWAGLTDEEMDDCWNKLFGTGNYNRRNVYRDIEAKLKEKNT